MIHINRIRIEAFRGIKKLQLEPQGQNFGICGPNGSGKSAIVDAIEFCLTGQITRLSGRGRGEISVEQHAGHIDFKSAPERSKVKIWANVPSLQHDITLSRSLANPSVYVVTPDLPEVHQIIRQIENHPEFVLARREVEKSISSVPSERANIVQTLLRLQKIGAIRASFNRYYNSCQSEHFEAKKLLTNARNEFKDILKISELKKDKILTVINQLREKLTLPSISRITSKTFFLAFDTQLPRTTKLKILDPETRLKNLHEQFEDFNRIRLTLVMMMEELLNDKNRLAGLQQRFNPSARGQQPSARNSKNTDKKIVDSPSKTDKEFKKYYDEITSSLANFRSYCRNLQKQLINPSKAQTLNVSDTDVNPLVIAVDTFLRSVDFSSSGLSELRDTLKLKWMTNSQTLATFNQVETTHFSLTETNYERDLAISQLTLIQDRFDRYTKVMTITSNKGDKLKKAEKLLEHFDKVSSATLESIYDEVAADFADYYKYLNSDESSFEGKLSSNGGRVDLAVDFHGRGKFPAIAYHSEGHQDSMGLCLFLALTKYSLKENFTIAVIDDVVGSVDISHRNKLCRLLRRKFPNTQFILTTHDPAWFHYMKTEGLLEDGYIFKNWNVDDGPDNRRERDIWDAIEASLKEDDVQTAKTLIRSHLAHIFAFLSDNL